MERSGLGVEVIGQGEWSKEPEPGGGRVNCVSISLPHPPQPGGAAAATVWKQAAVRRGGGLQSCLYSSLYSCPLYCDTCSCSFSGGMRWISEIALELIRASR